MKMLSGRSLKDKAVREDRVDCKPYNKFMLSTVNPEVSEEKVENKRNKFTVDSLLRTPLLNRHLARVGPCLAFFSPFM